MDTAPSVLHPTVARLSLVDNLLTSVASGRTDICAGLRARLVDNQQMLLMGSTGSGNCDLGERWSHVEAAVVCSLRASPSSFHAFRAEPTFPPDLEGS